MGAVDEMVLVGEEWDGAFGKKKESYRGTMTLSLFQCCGRFRLNNDAFFHQKRHQLNAFYGVGQ